MTVTAGQRQASAHLEGSDGEGSDGLRFEEGTRSRPLCSAPKSLLSSAGRAVARPSASRTQRSALLSSRRVAANRPIGGLRGLAREGKLLAKEHTGYRRNTSGT